MTEYVDTHETLEVDSLDQFVKLLVSWHTAKVALLKHMLEMPEGNIMEVDGKDIALSGDALVAFQAGINVAISEMGQLPFTYELEQATDA